MVKYDSRHVVNVFKEIESSILSFATITKLPITYFDSEGQMLLEYNENAKICRFIKNYKSQNGSCKVNLFNAMKVSKALSDPYIFSCQAGLINIVMPFICRGKNFGYFILGPMVLEKLTPKVLEQILKFNQPDDGSSSYILDSPKLLYQIMDHLNNMPCFSAKEVTALQNLFKDLVTAHTKEVSNSSKSESINLKVQSDYPLSPSNERVKKLENIKGFEDALVRHIMTGNYNLAENSMNLLFDETLVSSEGNINIIRLKLAEICGILSRKIMVENFEEQVQNISLEFLNQINEADNLHDFKKYSISLCQKLINLSKEEGLGTTPPLVKDTISYISEHVSEKITLGDMAKTLHVNPNYLSTLFKKTLDISFSEYLVNYRIQLAKDLLLTSNKNILDICQLVGFDSQSYFTKIFREKTGQSPFVFRKNKGSC